MMKRWRWKYNVNIVLVCVILFASMFSVFFAKPAILAQKGDLPGDDKEDETLVDDDDDIDDEELIGEVVDFSKYSEVQIFKMAMRKFNKLTYYESDIVGDLYGEAASIAGVTQVVSIKKKYDVTNDIAYVKFGTARATTLGIEKGFKYYYKDGVYKIIDGHYVDNNFKFDPKKVINYNKKDFYNRFKMNPVDLFLKLDKNAKLSKTKNSMKWKFNGIGGQLIYYIDSNKDVRTGMDFVESFVGDNLCKLTPHIDKIKITLDIDRYGNLKKMNYSFDFTSDVYLNIALAGLHNVSIENGRMEFTEIFKNFNKNYEIEDIAPKKEESKK